MVRGMGGIRRCNVLHAEVMEALKGRYGKLWTPSGFGLSQRSAQSPLDCPVVPSPRRSSVVPSSVVSPPGTLTA